MKRKLYNYCTLASVLMLCGTLWWWHHAGQNNDQVTLRGVGGSVVQVTASGGQFAVTTSRNDDKGGQLSWNSSSQGGDRKLMAMSFAFNSHPSKGTTLIIPAWAAAFAFGICPGLWVWSKIKRKNGKKKPEGA